MTLSALIHKISSREEIKNNPPVLIDIGASEKLNSAWKAIANFSVCIAFDADKREFEYIENNNSLFKKQYIYNKIVVASSDKAKQPFYLTKNPYCSSLLKPDNESLKGFHHSNLFEIDSTIELDVIELPKVLEQLNISYIDWFKTDSQGTDLRLFKALSDQQQNRALVVEFEPGFIDAYIGEDKIEDVISYMKSKPFFITDFTIKGALRVPHNVFVKLFNKEYKRKIARHTSNLTPGWAEMVYMNNLQNNSLTKREYLLSWLFATLLEHHDVAHTYASKGMELFKEPIFVELNTYSEKCLKENIFSMKSIFEVGKIIVSKIFSKK